MYTNLLKEHRAHAAVTRKQADALRAQALGSCEQVSAHLFSEVQAGVGALYRNQRLLQAEAATLQAHTSRFARQSERWLALSSSLHTALKELGDVHNWALTVQKDVRWVEKELQATLQTNNEKKLAIMERRHAEAAAAAQAKGAGQAAAAGTSGATPLPHPPAAAAAEQPHVHGADEELP
jgi:hypothetical protein